MAVSLTDLYARLGKLFGIAKAQIDARTGLLDRVTGSGAFSGVGLDSQYTASTRYMVTPVLDYFLNLYRTGDPSVQRAIAGGVKTLTEMITADNASIPKSVIPAMVELNRQMRAASQTLLQNVVTFSAYTPAGTNVGNGRVIFHTPYPQMSPTESLRFQCVGDVTTGAVPGREVFQVTGGLRQPDITSSQWPGGSGANLTITSSDYTDSLNNVQNGSFESWAGGVPNQWTVISGGAQFSQGSVRTYRGTSSLTISQSASGILRQTMPSVVIRPGQRIFFGAWSQCAINTPNDWYLYLKDGAGNTLQTVYWDSTAVSWTHGLASYTHPISAPVTTVTLEIDNGGGGGSTAIMDMDCVHLFIPPQAGVNGQFFQIISGSTNWRVGDYITATFSNNYASNVLTYTERFFAPFANGIELPTSFSPTINNSVIP
jgi:hypothetical protein